MQALIEEENSIGFHIFFVNKHLNGKKLSSHMWFFEGFCRLLNPKYVALIDVGTEPDRLGLINYYRGFWRQTRTLQECQALWVCTT